MRSRKDKIRDRETELRIIESMAFARTETGGTFHARHTKWIHRAEMLRKELGELSIRWKIKNILRSAEKR